MLSTAQRRCGARAAASVVTVTVALVLSGCGTASGAHRPATGQVSPGPVHTMADGTVMAGGEMPAQASAAAKMICTEEIKQKVAQMLGSARPPATTSMYSGGRFSCTYRLAEGALVLSVDEGTDPSTAPRALRAERVRLGASRAITGLAGLGLPGYETPAGAVVFAKDDKVLAVDARTLTAPVGKTRLARADLAYQVATDVLACWSGH